MSLVQAQLRELSTAGPPAVFLSARFLCIVQSAKQTPLHPPPISNAPGCCKYGCRDAQPTELMRYFLAQGLMLSACFEYSHLSCEVIMQPVVGYWDKHICDCSVPHGATDGWLAEFTTLYYSDVP